MKKIIAVTVVCLFGIASISMAAEDHPQKQHKDNKEHKMMSTSSNTAPENTKITDAGNKTCPITGEPINNADYVVYKGKKYGVCCKGCDKEFLKDPEKYLNVLREKGEIR